MVIPLWDQNPVRRTPVVTYVLIALNLLVFLTEPIALSVSGGGDIARVCRQEAYFERWGAIPKELVSNDPLDVAVTGEPAAPNACVAAPPTYRKQPFVSAMTSAFLHGGWFHLLGNMLFLFVFGNNVEDRLGRLRFLLCYLGWAVVATYAFALTAPSSEAVVVGASGAVAGVLGAYIVTFPRARVLSLVTVFFFFPMRLPAWLVLGFWFVLQAVYAAGGTLAAGSSVAYAAHVAGFLAGVLTAKALIRR